ncbi:methyl-accepting chemotaxis protein [Treponema lecithinolyticum]|uniref:methyl-accepting chemotaxis protein n=1 Tax=Treponema lecithinolyticum TaxID=53418 RepID=UPI0028E1D6B0|nr:methyl-accepting chemotaxis protein [Treponema lecithinolyticum]
MNQNEINDNFSDAIHKMNIRYNKSVVLDFVTVHSLEIIDEAMDSLQDGFNTILAAFEEIRAGSGSSAANASRVNQMMSEILENRKKLQIEIHKRVGEIETASQNAQNAASAFEILKERTSDVEDMLAGIQDVSVKTGILAINASIEAARAGKVGSGFRIIANEVRSLATQTGDFTKKIEAKLNEFREAVDEINGNMSVFIQLFSKFQKSFTGVLNNFDENSITMSQAGDSLAEITASIQEQANAIQDGVASLDKVNGSLIDTRAILDVVQISHSFLNRLLEKAD